MDGRTPEESSGDCVNPTEFNANAFRRVLYVIKKYKKYPNIFEQGAIIATANAAGGKSLADAMDPYQFAPCSATSICSSCWRNEWCVHKHVSSEDRLTIQYCLDVFTSKNTELTVEEDRIVYSTDKTNSTDIRRLEMVMLAVLFRSQNDTPKEQGTDESNALMWPSTDGMDELDRG